jgi:hypothetical protein
MIQRNALKSSDVGGSDCGSDLFGDEEGTSETAREMGAVVVDASEAVLAMHQNHKKLNESRAKIALRRESKTAKNGRRDNPPLQETS